MLYKMAIGIVLAYLLYKQRLLLAQVDDLNAAVTNLDTDLADVSANVSQVLVLLQSAQSTGSQPDLSSAITKLIAADVSLKSIDASLKGAEPAPVEPVDPPVEEAQNEQVQ